MPAGYQFHLQHIQDQSSTSRGSNASEASSGSGGSSNDSSGSTSPDGDRGNRSQGGLRQSAADPVLCVLCVPDSLTADQIHHEVLCWGAEVQRALRIRECVNVLAVRV